MFCFNCGVEIKKSDTFCYSCGFKNSHVSQSLFDPLSESSSRKKSNKRDTAQAKFNPKLLGGFIILLLIMVSPILILIIQGIGKGVRAEVAIQIEALDDQSNVENCRDENCKYIKIGNETYPLAKLTEEPNSLRKHIVDLAKRFDGKDDTPLTLFNENKRNRHFDLSLDISGSVTSLDRQDLERGAQIKYSDVVFNKMQEYLTEDEPLSPGDVITVRLYGPAQQDNPCKETLTVNYTDPEYKAKFVYSNRDKTALVQIGERMPPAISQNGSVVTTNDADVVFKAIQEFYSKGLGNPSRYCHTDTFLDQLLTRVLDNSLDKYNNNHYVLVNDGAFSFGSSFVWPSDYRALENYNNGSRSFITENALCKSEKDTFAVIGVDFKGDLSYRNALEKFYKKILNPCTVVFKNL
ncbi:MAG: zinc ribbon domain-containing protein [Candidatus Doudnabacteria bacterium]|nr:zinc ribbon domain-containing protein [Candidatus Doudnabacteria bacterium]